MFCEALAGVAASATSKQKIALLEVIANLLLVIASFICRRLWSNSNGLSLVEASILNNRSVLAPGGFPVHARNRVAPRCQRDTLPA